MSMNGTEAAKVENSPGTTAKSVVAAKLVELKWKTMYADLLRKCSENRVYIALTRFTEATSDRFKLGLVLTSLCLCSALAGSSYGARLLVEVPHRHYAVQAMLHASVKPVPTPQVIGVGPSMETSVAVQAAKIEEILKQNQVSIDDRALLHNEITAAANVEVNHYNTVTDRLNVADARVMTIGWVLGVLFTLSQAIVVFFHLDKRGSLRHALQQQQEVNAMQQAQIDRLTKPLQSPPESQVGVRRRRQ